MEGGHAGERPDPRLRSAGDRGQGVGRGGQGDGPRVRLSQRGREVSQHRAARSVDLGGDRVQLRRHRAHARNGHAGGLRVPRERRRKRKLLRGRHGPAVANALARGGPSSAGPGVLRDPCAVAQPDLLGAALLQLDDGGGVRSRRPGDLRARPFVSRAFGPRTALARRRSRALPAALPQQHVRRPQVLSRRRRAQRLLRRILPRRRLGLGTLGSLRRHAGPEDVALGALSRRGRVGGLVDRRRRPVRRVSSRKAVRSVFARRSRRQPRHASGVRSPVVEPVDRDVVSLAGHRRTVGRLSSRRSARTDRRRQPADRRPRLRSGRRHARGLVGRTKARHRPRAPSAVDALRSLVSHCPRPALPSALGGRRTRLRIGSGGPIAVPPLRDRTRGVDHRSRTPASCLRGPAAGAGPSVRRGPAYLSTGRGRRPLEPERADGLGGAGVALGALRRGTGPCAARPSAGHLRRQGQLPRRRPLLGAGPDRRRPRRLRLVGALHGVSGGLVCALGRDRRRRRRLERGEALRGGGVGFRPPRHCRMAGAGDTGPRDGRRHRRGRGASPFAGDRPPAPLRAGGGVLGASVAGRRTPSSRSPRRRVPGPDRPGACSRLRRPGLAPRCAVVA